MKNVYIHGSFMNDNYGDFLLYYVIQAILEKYEDNINWYSADIDKSYDKYCKVIRKNKRESIRIADMAIFAGGGYFGEPAKRKIIWNIRCFIKHILPAYLISKKKIPYIIVGVEAGPISLFLNRLLLKKIFNGAEVISVRNIESKRFLKKIKVDKKIEVNPDWIMGIGEKALPSTKINTGRLLDRAKQEKIIFLHLTTDNNNKGMNNVVMDLKRFQKNNDIIYIVGCDQKREKQKERAKILLNELNNSNNRLCLYQGPWFLSKILSEVDAVVTDKLHVGIVSTKFKKEVISVAYHPKSIRFYKSIGRGEWTSSLKDIKPGETYLKLKKLSYKPIRIDDSLFKKAEKNSKIVDDFLQKNINRCSTEK